MNKFNGIINSRLNIEKDNEIMRSLNVSEIRHHFAETSKGNLTALLRKGETKYQFLLDSVPVSDEVNTQLLTFYE